MVSLLQLAPFLAVAIPALVYGLGQTQLIPLARALGVDRQLCGVGCNDGLRLFANCEAVCRGKS